MKIEKPFDGKFAIVWFDNRNVKRIEKYNYIVKLPPVYKDQLCWITPRKAKQLFKKQVKKE